MRAQDFINNVNKEFQKQRAQTQMTLGKFITRLKELPLHTEIEGFYCPHSYRGYYCDLAFDFYENESVKITVSEALRIANNCLKNNHFKGYKGGDYVMNENTPLWIAEYGRTGKRIMALNDDGTFVLAHEHIP